VLILYPIKLGVVRFWFFHAKYALSAWECSRAQHRCIEIVRSDTNTVSGAAEPMTSTLSLNSRGSEGVSRFQCAAVRTAADQTSSSAYDAQRRKEGDARRHHLL
jgi:hypothetical protein